MPRRPGLSELGELLHAFDEVIAKVPEARERALKAAIQPVERELFQQIALRLPGKDRNYHVRGWQEVTMGSRGGYIKIQAAKEETNRYGYTARQITGYLERGHKMVLPKRNRYRDVDRSSVSKSDRTVENTATGDLVVPGYLFYSYTKMRAVNAARMAAESVLEELEDTLEDALE